MLAIGTNDVELKKTSELAVWVFILLLMWCERLTPRNGGLKCVEKMLNKARFVGKQEWKDRKERWFNKVLHVKIYILLLRQKVQKPNLLKTKSQGQNSILQEHTMITSAHWWKSFKRDTKSVRRG